MYLTLFTLNCSIKFYQLETILYVFQAMIYYIEMTDNVSAEDAEKMYLDASRHVDQRDVEETRRFMKMKSIDADTMVATIERARQRLSRARSASP